MRFFFLYAPNRDAAARCLEIGQQSLRIGKYAKAVKFLSKSQRLYPKDATGALLKRARAKLLSAHSQSKEQKTPSAAPRPTPPRPAAR